MSIEVQQVTKFYGKQKALNKINFKLNKGDIVGFLGPNGAGKSTMMKIITGFISDFEGNVFVNGYNIKTQKILAQQKIGYLPEHNPLYNDMFVKEYLYFIEGLYKVDTSAVKTVIEKVGLQTESHKKISQLSKGFRQRVGLAAALLPNPEVLILDEPTTGLDPNQLVEIRNLIKEVSKNTTVLFSTHIMQEVEAMCNRVLIINHGKLIADKNLDEIMNSSSKNLETFFKELTT